MPYACPEVKAALTAADDGSGAQQWVVTKIEAGPTASPSPSPSSSPNPAPSPSPPASPPPSGPAATVPGAPTNVAAAKCKNGNSCGTVTWTDPASDGGSPITGYEVTCTSAGGVAVGHQSFPAGATSTGVGAFTGLLPGVPYTCTVVAVNTVGKSSPSAPSNKIMVEEEEEEEDVAVQETYTIIIPTNGDPVTAEFVGSTTVAIPGRRRLQNHKTHPYNDGTGCSDQPACLELLQSLQCFSNADATLSHPCLAALADMLVDYIYGAFEAAKPFLLPPV